jgi:hypothetical protein
MDVLWMNRSEYEMFLDLGLAGVLSCLEDFFFFFGGTGV